MAFPLAARAAACAGFTDVDSGASYCAAVGFVKNKGITAGCTTTEVYCPDLYVTRAQMASFMLRLARGGPHNILYDATAAIGGGDQNATQAQYASIGGGYQNQALAWGDTVGGGSQNIAGSPDGSATIGGGYQNHADGDSSVVAGGWANAASGHYGTVAGGGANAAIGDYSMSAGGYANSATGMLSFAAGYGATAAGSGSFVWADSTPYGFDPATATNGWASVAATDNTFNARAVGGVWFVTGVNGSGNPTAGVKVNPGSGSWASVSDRAAKENFRSIDAQDLLARVAAMPIESWNYIAEGAGVRHIGPVAQDFHGLFGVGPDDRTITTVDESGVALVAIQALNARLERENAELRARNATLEAHRIETDRRLEALERAVLR